MLQKKLKNGFRKKKKRKKFYEVIKKLKKRLLSYIRLNVKTYYYFFFTLSNYKSFSDEIVQDRNGIIFYEK